MIDRRCTLALVLAVFVPALALAATGGPDSFGYSWADQNEAGVDSTIPPDTAGSTDIVLTNESVSIPIDLGFSFPFYGVNYTKFVISDNGWMSFDTALTNPYPGNSAIPATPDPNKLIAWYWRDLDVPLYMFYQPVVGGMAIYFLTKPVGGNYNIGGAILLLKTGVIKLIYSGVEQENTASVGIENAGGTVGLNPWFRGVGSNGFLLANSAVLQFNPPPKLSCAASTSVGCGKVSSASPATLPVNVTDYSCSPTTYLGREKVFKFTNPTLSDVTFSLSNVTPGIKLEILVLRAGFCNEFQCLKGGPAPYTIPFLAKGDYYVVVDGLAATDNGNFDLTIGCTPKSAIIACQPPATPPYTGATSGVSQWTTYPCTNQLMDGPEFIYELPFTPPGNIKAVLTHDPGSELDLMIFGPNSFNPPNGCVAWGNENLTLYNPAAGTYYIVVDGRSQRSALDPPGTYPNLGPYTLGVTCDVLLKCAAPAADLQCFVDTPGTTVGALDRAEQYSCSPDLFTGPEVLYSFRNDTRRTVSFIFNGPSDLSLFLVNSCNEGACIQYGNGRLVARDLPVGDYFLVVDGKSATGGAFTITPVCYNRVDPVSASVILKPGESFHETKTTWVNADITRGDVVISVDTTGSMAARLPAVKDSATRIINELSKVINDVQFGVVSFEDYPNSFNYCGYSAGYGGGADRPYRLNLPMSNNLPLLQSTIVGLPGGGGGDLPESYLRVWYEMYADATNIGWRTGSRKIAVMFGDDVPHQCDGGACSNPPNNDTGVDPGRDGIAGTIDDVYLGPTMDELVRQAITPIYASCGNNHKDEWACWLARGKGTAYDAPGGAIAGSVVDDLRILIEERALHCDALEAKASAGFQTWIQNVVPSALNTSLPVKVKFDFDIVPPIGTSPGIYNFTVDMVCDGIVKASQNVTLEVPGSCVPNPQVSLAGPTCPGNTRTLDATASKITGCSGTVEYQWKDSLGNLLTPPGPFSSANSVLTQSPAASTSYTLEIRCSDTTGCPTLGTKTIPVNVDPLPPANAGPDLSLCLTFAGTLGTPAVAGLTYDWSPPTELSNPFIAQPIFSTTGTSPLGIRNYTLTVTDPGTGCKSTSTVKVTVISGSPVGSVANALRAVKKSLDVNLSWPLGALVPRTYNVHREDAKAKLVIPLPTLPIGQASNVEVYTDPGAIPAGTRLFFYRVYGRDCAGNSVYN